MSAFRPADLVVAGDVWTLMKCLPWSRIVSLKWWLKDGEGCVASKIQNVSSAMRAGSTRVPSLIWQKIARIAAAYLGLTCMLGGYPTCNAATACRRRVSVAVLLGVSRQCIASHEVALH